MFSKTPYQLVNNLRCGHKLVVPLPDFIPPGERRAASPTYMRLKAFARGLIKPLDPKVKPLYFKMKRLNPKIKPLHF
jgi:hypothetical protein